MRTDVACKLVALLTILFASSYAINVEDTTRIQLWPEGAPFQIDSAPGEPSLLVFKAPQERANGMGVLVCPGGGYGTLTWDREGSGVGRWLARNGITAFVLKYRVAPYRHPVPLTDAKRGMRMARHRASEFGVDPDRIGVMGFSAGGHLATTLLTHYDSGDSDATDPIEKQGCRPAFGSIHYAVISMLGNHAPAHVNSKNNLLGENPDTTLLIELSNELHVNSETPPCFLTHGNKDGFVWKNNSIKFHQACIDSGISSELMILDGLGHSYNAHSLWTDVFLTWVYEQGFADPQASPAQTTPSRDSTISYAWEFRPNGVSLTAQSFLGDEKRKDCQSGCFTFDCSPGRKVHDVCPVGSVNRGDWVKYNSVDFECGLVGIGCYAARGGPGGLVEFTLGSLAGTRICTLSIKETGDWFTMDTSKTAVSPPLTGTHDVYAVGASDGTAGTFTFTYFYTYSDGKTGSAPNWLGEAVPGEGDSVSMTCPGVFNCYDTVYWDLATTPEYLKLRSKNTVFDFTKLKEAGIDTLKVQYLDHTAGKLNLPADFIIAAPEARFEGSPRNEQWIAWWTDPEYFDGLGAIRIGSPASANKWVGVPSYRVSAAFHAKAIHLSHAADYAEVFNGKGRLVFSGTDLRRIDMSNYSRGTYMLRLSRRGLTQSFRGIAGID